MKLHLNRIVQLSFRFQSGKLLLKARSPTVSHLRKRCYASKKFSPANLRGKLGIVGVPFGKGQKEKGKYEVGLKAAPDVIRRTDFIEVLDAIGVELSDYGNIEYEPESGLAVRNMHNLDHVVPCARAVSEAVECILGKEKSCLVLGGDHSIGIGSIHGHLEVADPRRVALLYIDAHADANTSWTSPSGNIHGMTVAMLSGELQDAWDDAGLQGMEWMKNRLVLPNMAYIGLRSVDKGEVKFLSDNNIAVFGIDDIDRIGIYRVIQTALEKIDPRANRSIHVSFDIDSVDPLEAPCTTVPVRGGLTLREAICLAECLHKTKRVSVVDLVEVNVAMGTENQRELTLGAVTHILTAMYGYKRKGNGPKEETEKIKICD